MQGEMHLEINAHGFDEAVRMCAAVVLPTGTHVWVTNDDNAVVSSYAQRIGRTPSKDVLEIYVDAEGADSGFSRDASREEVLEYVRALRSRGWRVKKKRI